MGGGTGQASVPSPGSVTTVGSPGGDPWWPLPQPSVSGILGDSLVLGYETANLGPFRERDIYMGMNSKQKINNSNHINSHVVTMCLGQELHAEKRCDLPQN